MLRRLRLSVGAQYISEPAFMREEMPLTVTPTLPSRMMQTSSLGSVSGLVCLPGSSRVMWVSSARKVVVACDGTTAEREPVGVAITGSELVSMTEEPNLPDAFCVAAEGALAAAGELATSETKLTT